ncbi:MAG: PQQ-binding-like beta-propeller repeat protein, partial [Candidatus Eremiobacteraeota bacterium]|nr:PQQ-binding-like beta-propeller repeat protein [Candidatus Eremiobacteraeota bacterium]
IGLEAYWLSSPETVIIYSSVSPDRGMFEWESRNLASRESPGDTKVILGIPKLPYYNRWDEYIFKINGNKFILDYPARAGLTNEKNISIVYDENLVNSKPVENNVFFSGPGGLNIYITRKKEAHKDPLLSSSQKNIVIPAVPSGNYISGRGPGKNPAYFAPYSTSPRNIGIIRVKHSFIPWKWQVISKLVPIPEKIHVPEKWPEPLSEPAINYRFVPLGWGDKHLTHPLPVKNTSNAAQYIAHMIRDITYSDVGIINYMALRGDLVGPISPEDIKRILPFDNKITILKMKGSLLKEIFNSNPLGKGHLAFSGINNSNTGEFKDNKIYQVATISYLAKGGSGSHLQFLESEKMRETSLYLNDLLIDRIVKQKFIFLPGKYTPVKIKDDLSAGKWQKCLKKLKKLKKNAPSDWRINFTMGEIYLFLGKPHLAIQPLYKAWNKMKIPETAICLYVSDLLCSKMEPIIPRKPGFPVIEKEKLIPMAPEALCITAIEKIKNDRIKQAGRLLKQALSMDPENVKLIKLVNMIPGPSPAKPPYPAQSLHGQWPRFRGDPQGTGRSPAKGPDQPKLAGMVKTGYEIMSSPAIGENGTVYFGSGDCNLYAISPAGEILWKFGTENPVLSSPAITREHIYFGSDDGWFYCLDHSGDICWCYPAGGKLLSSPNITTNGLVIFGVFFDGTIQALTAEGKPAWSYRTGDFVFSSPATNKEGRIFFGSGDRHLYCIDQDGNFIWKYKTGGKIYSSPLVDDKNVYFGSDDSRFYALDISGKYRWSLETVGPIPGSSALTKSGNILVPSEDSNLYCLDRSGRVIWACDLDSEVFSAPLVDSENRAYLGSEENNIYCVSPKGKILWKYRTGQYVNSSPALSLDGRLYIGSNDGYLYIFGKEK